jgi:hypothetical protein
MPQRFLRPGITTSEAWNRASWFEQSFFIRLLTLVDDEGRYDGRIPILHAHCFALRSDVTPQQTAAARSALLSLGLIGVYTVDGKEYLQVAKWQERVRTRSKWPASPDSKPQRSAAIRCDPLLPSPSPSPSPEREERPSPTVDTAPPPTPKSSLPPPPFQPGEVPAGRPPSDLVPRIERLHRWFCEATGQKLSLLGRERYWWAWINAGFTDQDLETVVEHLRREIRRRNRNAGALKLMNLLDPERFEDDLNQTRLKASGAVPPIDPAAQTRSNPPQRETPPPPHASPEQLKRWAGQLGALRGRLALKTVSSQEPTPTK